MMTCERHLRWYLLVGAGSVDKSLQGALLEKAETTWFMSDGRRAPQVNKNDWNYMTVHPVAMSTPHALMDEAGVMLSCSVRSILARVPELQRAVLQALWGPIGESWAEVEGRRRDFAVYPLTSYGKTWLKDLRAQGIEGTPDVVLDSQHAADDDLRKLKFKRMQQEADILIAEANIEWKKAQELPSTSV